MNISRKVVRNVLWVLAFLLLSNFSFIFRRCVILLFAPDETLSFRYTLLHRDLNLHEEVSWKSGHIDYERVQERFKRYQECHPTTQDTVLYRTFTKHPWEFWNWIAFFTHPRYTLPYIDPATLPKTAEKYLPSICPGEF